MKEQGAECEHGTFRGETYALGLLRTNGIDRVGPETPEPMRAIDHSHRAILDGTWIEMEANSEHVLENVGRRLDVRHTTLLRPWPVARDVDAGFRGDGEVLVPNDSPVRVGRLVEEERADGEAGLAENSRSKPTKGRRRGECGDVRLIEQVTRAAATSLCERRDTLP